MINDSPTCFAKITLALVFVLGFSKAQALTLELLPASGATEFLAVGQPGFIKIKGKASVPQGQLVLAQGEWSGELKLPVDELDTGLNLRNQHMREKYLKSQSYPFIVLKLVKQKVDPSWTFDQGQKASGQLDGVVRIMEQESPVQVHYQIDGNNKVKADFKIKISDYAIGTPEFMGVKVADHVEVQVTGTLAKATLPGKVP
jgi:hypothetical protein